jgi:3-methyladenine DNA glycosylase/8-oxoguanine DNA glycosylase
LAFLALRATPGVEQVAGGAYLRRVRHGRASGVVRVEHRAAGACIVVSVPADLSPTLSRVLACARRTFDLTADPHTIARTLGADPALAARVRRNPGLRVPGAWDPFEIAVRAVVGQQISVRGATTLMGRIAERFGTRHGATGTEPHLVFPPAEALADADLSKIGMPGARSRAIGALARAVASGAVTLDGSRPLAESMAELESLPGVGPWTAAYVAMRALGEPDAFPAGDLGVRRALAARNGALPSIAEARARADQWRPWRAYATLHLWTGEPAQSTKPAIERTTARPEARKAKEASRATAA